MDLSGYKLTFSEEFNDRSISQSGAGTTWSNIRPEWRFDANSDIGFGNSSFVDAASGYDPFKVENGVLSITAVPDHTSSGFPGSWESGLIHTRDSFTQQYGYFEMRADLADTMGAWDAFWMMPLQVKDPNNTGEWQELDIVEHYGHDPGSVYRWIHTTDHTVNANEERQVTSWHADQTTGFHTYGVDWQADKLSFYYDGQFMGSRPTPSDMHDPMYILANLAVQDSADDAGVPMTMKIDYIKAYSNAEDAVAAPAPVPPVAEAAPPPAEVPPPAVVPPAEPPHAQPSPSAGSGSATPPPVFEAEAPPASTPPSGEAPASETPTAEAPPQEASPEAEPPEPTPVAEAAPPPAPSVPVAGGELPSEPAPTPAPVAEVPGQGSGDGVVPTPVVPTTPVAAADPEPAPAMPAPEAPAFPSQPQPAGGGGQQMDAFLSLFNAAQEGSFKYVYCAPGGQATEMAQRGATSAPPSAIFWRVGASAPSGLSNHPYKASICWVSRVIRPTPAAISAAIPAP